MANFGQSDACFLVVQVDFLTILRWSIQVLGTQKLNLRLVKCSGLRQGSGPEPEAEDDSKRPWTLGGGPARSKGHPEGCTRMIQHGRRRNAGRDKSQRRTRPHRPVCRSYDGRGVVSELEQTMVTWRRPVKKRSDSRRGIPTPFVDAVIISATDNVAIRMR